MSRMKISGVKGESSDPCQEYHRDISGIRFGARRKGGNTSKAPATAVEEETRLCLRNFVAGSVGRADSETAKFRSPH